MSGLNGEHYKLEIAKKEIEESLAKVKKQPINFEQRIVKVQTFQAFAENYRKFIKNADHEVKKQMVQKFIKKVEIGVDEVKIHWNLDQEHYERELALRGRSAEGQVFLINVGSNSMTSGAQVKEVGKHLASRCALFIFEMEAYPEPKVLSPIELGTLYAAAKSFQRVADLVGASEAFVRQTCQINRKP